MVVKKLKIRNGCESLKIRTGCENLYILQKNLAKMFVINIFFIILPPNS